MRGVSSDVAGIFHPCEHEMRRATLGIHVC